MNADNDFAHGHKSNGKGSFVTNADNEDLNRAYDAQLVTEKFSQIDANYGYEFGPFGTVDREFQDSGVTEVECEENGPADEIQLCSTHEDEYEIFELRIIHRKNRFKTAEPSHL